MKLASKKAKVGFFSLSCCEGCVLAVLDLEEKLLQAFKQIEIVESRLLMEKVKPSALRLDIAFVEGSVVSKHDLNKLQYIREKSDFLVALGACATIAGIPGIRNALPPGLKEKIKRQAIKPIKEKVFPLTAFVKVDYLLQGCSIGKRLPSPKRGGLPWPGHICGVRCPLPKPECAVHWVPGLYK